MIKLYRRNYNFEELMHINSIPSNQAQPSAGDGSDAALTQVGVSVIQETINGVTMYFPVARSSEGDGNYSPNEAFGYYLRAYANAGDQDAFQKMLNGLYYLMNQSNLNREQGQGMWDNWHEEGLIGWNINIGNIFNGQSPYSSADSSDLNTASDADEDIIGALIDGFNRFGDLTATDPLSHGTLISSTSDAQGSTIQLGDMIKLSINAFVNSDFQSNGVLSLGDFQSGKANPYSDYFDPTEFAKMITFLQNNPTPPSNINWNTVPQGQPSFEYNAAQDISALKQDAQATWTYISNAAASNGGWITNNVGNSGGVGAFGYEATRSLMRFGEYLLYCKQMGTDPLGILNDSGSVKGVASTLQTLVSNLFAQGGFEEQGGTIGFSQANSPGGLFGGEISGPLYVALMALKEDNLLPSTVTPSIFSEVESADQYDSTHYDGGTYTPPTNGGYGNQWQQNSYFPTSLAILSGQIASEYQA